MQIKVYDISESYHLENGEFVHLCEDFEVNGPMKWCVDCNREFIDDYDDSDYYRELSWE